MLADDNDPGWGASRVPERRLGPYVGADGWDPGTPRTPELPPGFRHRGTPNVGGISMPEGEMILSRHEADLRVQLHDSSGTIWLTQAEFAKLHATSVSNCAQTFKRMLVEGETSDTTINSGLTVRMDGTREVHKEDHVYGLDMVFAVGFRSASPRAAWFRQWATSTLREYLVKNCAMAEEKLKGAHGSGHFDEWLEPIRSIRASEKHFHQKARDPCATAVDHDPRSTTSHAFFATAQKEMP